MANFSEKISKLLRINGNKFATIEDLEIYSGLGRQTIRKAFNENREPSRRILAKMLSSLNITEDEWDKAEFTPVLKIDKGGSHKIPLYDAYAVAGHALIADDSPVIEPVAYVDPGDLFPKATGILSVYGHSGFPKYPAGCKVAFRESTFIDYGCDYVLEIDGKRVIKRVQKSKSEGCIQLNSYNSMKDETGSLIFAPFDVDLKQITRMYMVLGKLELEVSL